MSALTGLPENAPDGSPSVSALVRELSARNLFVSSVDADGSVIRYHSLFREFLLKTLQTHRTPADVRRTYAVAARWFKTAGDPVRAIDLWIGSGQEKMALREIESCAQHLIAGGRTQTLLRWMNDLPKAAAHRPWFALYRSSVGTDAL
jgi:LuxR family maltose regulon positive regulatory protein